jgi:hypothetical protein
MCDPSEGSVAIDHIGRDQKDEDAEDAVEQALARGQPRREQHAKHADDEASCRFTLEPETGVDLGKKWH